MDGGFSVYVDGLQWEVEGGEAMVSEIEIECGYILMSGQFWWGIDSIVVKRVVQP